MMFPCGALGIFFLLKKYKKRAAKALHNVADAQTLKKLTQGESSYQLVR
jgi:hypothetical protein